MIESVNWYAYTSNNPVKYVDPTGESLKGAMLGFGKAAFGALEIAGGLALGALAVGGEGGSAGLATPIAIPAGVLAFGMIVDGLAKVAFGLSQAATEISNLDANIPDSIGGAIGMQMDAGDGLDNSTEAGPKQMKGELINSGFSTAAGIVSGQVLFNPNAIKAADAINVLSYTVDGAAAASAAHDLEIMKQEEKK